MKCPTDCACGRHRKIDRPWTRSPRERRQVNPESYDAVHHQIKKYRGRAALARCVDCGGDGQVWSFDHRRHLEDAIQEIIGKRRIYSLDIDHYSPRCRSCHARYDLRPETGARISAALTGKPKPQGFASKHPRGSDGRFYGTRIEWDDGSEELL